MKVGVAKVDISPPGNGRIKREGYLLETYIEGVHDPIFATALVIQSGDTKVAILGCDLLWLERQFTDPIVREIEARTGIPGGHIMVTCSHTHSAPQATDNALVSKDEQYVATLGPKMVEAMVTANGNLVDAQMGIARGHEDRVGHNSRFMFEDGTIAWRSPFEGEPATPTGPIDPDVPVLAFADGKDQLIAAFYNYACHTSSAGYGQVSADYPGVIAQMIESQFGGIALYTRGSCGNIHPSEPAERLGAMLGETVLDCLRTIEYKPADALASVKQEVMLPLRDLDPTEMERVDYICDKTNAKTAEDRKTYFRACYKRFEALRATTDVCPTFLHALRIGDAVLVGVPGEQFVQAGLEIKQRSKCANTIIVNLANDSIGYIPTRKGYAEGGYQTWIGACNIAPEAGEMIVEESLLLIEKVI